MSRPLVWFYGLAREQKNCAFSAAEVVYGLVWPSSSVHGPFTLGAVSSTRSKVTMKSSPLRAMLKLGGQLLPVER